MIIAKHSKYWLSDYVKNTLDDNKFNIFRLANIKHAISNYTKILSQKDIKIVYSDLKKSYSTSENIVAISNECDNNIDLTVGIALHEIGHIEYSDFACLHELAEHLPQLIKTKLNNKSTEYFDWIYNFKFIINIVEDYRINTKIIHKYPGYAPYIQEIDNVYVFNNSIASQLISKNYTTEDWNSYRFRILYNDNPKSNTSVLKELDYIIKILDTNNISRLNSIYDSRDLAKQIISIIFNAVYHPVEKAKLPDVDIKNQKLTGNANANNNTNSNIKKQIDAFIDFISGNEKKKILKTKEQNQIIDLINETNSHYVNVPVDGEDTQVLIIKNFTKNLIDTNVGIFTDLSAIIEENEKVIQQGINLGKCLADKIDCLNDIKSTKYSYLKKGKIDNRLINTIGYGNDSVFYKEEIDEIKTVDFHLSIDLSGSMSGIKIHNSLICAIALAYCASIINSLNVVIDFRFTTSLDNNISPCVLLAYNSKIDNIQKIQTLFKYISPSGSTPEGLCFASILNIIRTYDSDEKYFINFSDGMPEHINYSGQKALDHTKGQADLIKKSGVKVISYFISDVSHGTLLNSQSKEWFKYMYGLDSRFIDVTDIVQIANTLNSKLLEN